MNQHTKKWQERMSELGQMCEMVAIMKDGKLVMVGAKDPTSRRPTIIDITEDLARFLADVPESTPPQRS